MKKLKKIQPFQFPWLIEPWGQKCKEEMQLQCKRHCCQFVFVQSRGKRPSTIDTYPLAVSAGTKCNYLNKHFFIKARRSVKCPVPKDNSVILVINFAFIDLCLLCWPDVSRLPKSHEKNNLDLALGLDHMRKQAQVSCHDLLSFLGGDADSWSW